MGQERSNPCAALRVRDAALTRDREAAGLGIAIARPIAELSARHWP